MGKLLKVKIDISNKEIMVNFPISLFPEVSKIVPFVRKALRKTPYTEEEKRKLVLNLHKGLLSKSRGINLNGANSRGKDREGNLIPEAYPNPDVSDRKSYRMDLQREVNLK